MMIQSKIRLIINNFKKCIKKILTIEEIISKVKISNNKNKLTINNMKNNHIKSIKKLILMKTIKNIKMNQRLMKN